MSIPLKTDSQIVNFVMKNINKYVAVKFGASWCAPCQRLAPDWERYSTECHDSGSNMSCGSASVDDVNASAIAGSDDVALVPTVVLFCDGKEIGRIQSSKIDLVTTHISNCVRRHTTFANE
jgi:thioredoxin-like negative regulator of GroEL